MKTYTAKLLESGFALNEDSIRTSIQKRLKQVLKVFSFSVDVKKIPTGFSIEFVVSAYEAKILGGISGWKKWLKDDLGIDPKCINGSRKKYAVWNKTTGEYEYTIWIDA